MEIKLNKALVQQIDSKRIELDVKQKMTLTQQEMGGVLLKVGIENYAPRFSEKTGTRVRRDRPGVLCFGTDKGFTLLGALHEATPEECVSLLNKVGAQLIAIFGEPGCGVTTLIHKIQSLVTSDVDVYDEGNPDSVNIPKALAALGGTRKVIVSLNARSLDEADRTLTRFTPRHTF